MDSFFLLYYCDTSILGLFLGKSEIFFHNKGCMSAAVRNSFYKL